MLLCLSVTEARTGGHHPKDLRALGLRHRSHPSLPDDQNHHKSEIWPLLGESHFETPADSIDLDLTSCHEQSIDDELQGRQLF